MNLFGIYPLCTEIYQLLNFVSKSVVNNKIQNICIVKYTADMLGYIYTKRCDCVCDCYSDIYKFVHLHKRNRVAWCTCTDQKHYNLFGAISLASSQSQSQSLGVNGPLGYIHTERKLKRKRKFSSMLDFFP